MENEIDLTYFVEMRLLCTSSHHYFSYHFIRFVLLLMLIVVGLQIDDALGLAMKGTAPTESYRVVHTYPHDSSAFTQGLVVVDGMLY
jgi:glutamine cyclotransferase